MKAWSSLHITPTVRDAAINAAAEAYSVSPRQIEGRTKTKRIAHARQYAMWLLRERRRPTGERCHGWSEIGRVLGRDHTTAVHAWRQVEARLAEQELLRAA